MQTTLRNRMPEINIVDVLSETDRCTKRHQNRQVLNALRRPERTTSKLFNNIVGYRKAEEDEMAELAALFILNILRLRCYAPTLRMSGSEGIRASGQAITQRLRNCANAMWFDLVLAFHTCKSL